ncbi:putative membrane protein [Sphingobium xenophagum]|uniref:Membrane protein n=1 Tax=Sphingobium xenophagum TaxID=121428 RepID=A0ABU1X6C4_SPHXE|nr:putative membrane protein [Sphingobium xenophagum]
MSSASSPYRPLLSPPLAVLLSFPVALFTIALFTDITYLQTAEVQWTNFSSWLIVGALVFGGVAFAWSLILAIRWRAARLYTLLLALAWTAGLVNAFQHSRDAWSSVGTTGLILLILSAALAIAASWLAHGAAQGIAR